MSLTLFIWTPLFATLSTFIIYAGQCMTASGRNLFPSRPSATWPSWRTNSWFSALPLLPMKIVRAWMTCLRNWRVLVFASPIIWSGQKEMAKRARRRGASSRHTTKFLIKNCTCTNELEQMGANSTDITWIICCFPPRCREPLLIDVMSFSPRCAAFIMVRHASVVSPSFAS